MNDWLGLVEDRVSWVGVSHDGRKRQGEGQSCRNAGTHRVSGGRVGAIEE